MTFLLLIFAIIFVLAPVAQAYAKRLNPPDVPGVKPGEIARLREEMEMLAAQVSRLQDEQSFMLRLLSEGQKPLIETKRDEERPRDQGRNRPAP
jgi:hypothetical protein